MKQRDLFVILAMIETDECVVWTGNTDAAGGGHFRGKDRRTMRCARSALTLREPPPTPQHQAAHGPCHNPSCMNYRHLSWKTPSENQLDRERDGTGNKGERHGRAILTETQVMDARRRHAAGETIGALGREYGVARSTIRSALTGKTWSHLAAA